jgi:hypothetical protein
VSLAKTTLGSVPVPDPTELTTAALLREVANVRELVENRIGATRETVEAKLQGNTDVLLQRLDGMDKAIELLQRTTDQLPGQIKDAVDTLRGLHSEKFDNLSALMEEQFKGVQTQFRERDTRTEQSSKDSKVAVDAALQAAKEAVGEQNKSSALAIAKSEAATNKQLDQIGTIMNATTNGLNDKIDDLKTRLTTVEGRWQGVAPAQLTPSATSPPILGYALGGLAIVLLVIIIIFEVTQRGTIH